jgi:hypothetical protein
MYAMLAAWIDPLLAIEAADEWNGGTVRAYELGNRDCARATFSAPADGMGAMFDAWSAWEFQAPTGAHVRAQPGSITVDACAEESSESDADPVEVVTTLALRNEILLGALSEGISRVDAPCLANSLLEDEAAANALDALVAPDIPDGDARTVLRQRQAEIRRECAELSGSPTG